VVDGKTYHFSAGGLYNGLILLIDDETRSYWDHISGEALHGSMAGQQLPMWGIEQSTVKALLQSEPELPMLLSKQGWWPRLMAWLGEKWTGKFPPGFRLTMDKSDDRLGEMTIGLGIADGDGRFYTLDQIGDGLDDEWHGQLIRVSIDPVSGVPNATYADGSLPPQLFSRWYGYSRSYPNCQIYTG
jgi:hypothetical protein